MQKGKHLVVANAQVTRYIPPGRWRVQVQSSAWASRTVTVQTGLDDEVMIPVPSAAFTANNSIVIDGGCFVRVSSSGNYANLTALVALAQSGVR